LGPAHVAVARRADPAGDWEITSVDEWPRQLPQGGFLFRDVAGDLYRLSRPARLDRGSRALLWAFVDRRKGGRP
jgi:hypothetical protein